ncbi:MAG: type II toxin-antitoxin system PemK/MazF family toxin [Bacteroidota bacterium]
MKIEQYQVVIVNLDPIIGQEIKKTRPCVVVSPDEMNSPLGTIMVAPCTSTDRNYPTRVKIKIGRRISFAAIDQIRTISKRRVYQVKKKLKEEEIAVIKAVIKETYVD